MTGRLILGGIFAALLATALWLFYGAVDDEKSRGRGRGPVSIVSETVKAKEFSDIVAALGTARARESVILTSRVSDTVSLVQFDDGQIVKKGDLLVKLVSVEEEAQYQEAAANFAAAETQFSRQADLLKRGNTSTAAYDGSRRTLAEARFRLDATKARLNDRRITAPFDGILGLRQVSEGSFLSSNTAITTLDAVDQIKLDFTVPERFIATLKPGQLVAAKVEAYPGRLFKGIVKTVDSRVDPVTRSVLIRAEIPNEDNALRPGLLMTVEVTSRSWQALAVPEEAVIPSGRRNFVFLVVGDETVRREVTLGLRRPGYVEVLTGLKAGDNVVVEGTFRLGRPGAKVRDLRKDLQTPEKTSVGDSQ